MLQVEPFEPAQPGPGQVLVRQTAVGLNFIDTYVRSGLYPSALPSGLGGEAAGVVAALGEGADTFKVGDRVGYCTLGPGSYTTHRVADQDKLAPIPDGISDEQAAAALLKGCTAEYLIERCAKVEAGQWVLVHAAAGGVGTILVQWLKAIGARVIAHAGNAEKAALATELGADHALSCPLSELADAVKAITGVGAPVVLDGVGAASWTASLASVAPRGLIVSYGNASGPVPPFTALDLMQRGSIFVTRPTLGTYCATAPELRTSAARMFAMIASGAVAQYVPSVGRVTKIDPRCIRSSAVNGGTGPEALP